MKVIMANKITSIRAHLSICHRPVSWRDVTTWEDLPEEKFSSVESFQKWVKKLYYDPAISGGSKISFYECFSDGTDQFYSLKYAYWEQLLPKEWRRN